MPAIDSHHASLRTGCTVAARTRSRSAPGRTRLSALSFPCPARSEAHSPRCGAHAP
ncbi:hypothetical protein DA2_1394 [Desulfovibrio sp. A2]|nr:hypothetical protein DA2_1394 [Desulfovibrio sp. A2]